MFECAFLRTAAPIAAAIRAVKARLSESLTFPPFPTPFYRYLDDNMPDWRERIERWEKDHDFKRDPLAIAQMQCKLALHCLIVNETHDVTLVCLERRVRFLLEDGSPTLRLSVKLPSGPHGYVFLEKNHATSTPITDALEYSIAQTIVEFLLADPSIAFRQPLPPPSPLAPMPECAFLQVAAPIAAAIRVLQVHPPGSLPPGDSFPPPPASFYQYLDDNVPDWRERMNRWIAGGHFKPSPLAVLQMQCKLALHCLIANETYDVQTYPASRSVRFLLEGNGPTTWLLVCLPSRLAATTILETSDFNGATSTAVTGSEHSIAQRIVDFLLCDPALAKRPPLPPIPLPHPKPATRQPRARSAAEAKALLAIEAEIRTAIKAETQGVKTQGVEAQEAEGAVDSFAARRAAYVAALQSRS